MSTEQIQKAHEDYFTASQSQLIWARFKRQRAAMVATCSTQRSDDAARRSDGETASGEQYPLYFAAGDANDRFPHSSDDEEEEVAEPEIVASETDPARSVHAASGPRGWQTSGADDETAAAASAAKPWAMPSFACALTGALP